MATLDNSVHAIAISADTDGRGNDIVESSCNITRNECSLDGSTYRDSSVRVCREVKLHAIEVFLDCFSDLKHLGASAHHDHMLDLFIVEVNGALK